MTSISNLLDWQRDSRSFESIAAWQRPSSVTWVGKGLATELTASFVTGSFFAVLGVDAATGRTFAPEEGTPGHAGVAVLSHAFWQKRFAGDAGIVGKTIILDSKSYQVLGVMPAGLSFPQDAELWVPLSFDIPEMKLRKAHFMRPIGRLKAGVTLTQAQADTDAIAARLEQQEVCVPPRSHPANWESFPVSRRTPLPTLWQPPTCRCESWESRSSAPSTARNPGRHPPERLPLPAPA
jgi:hypothetical protein